MEDSRGRRTAARRFALTTVAIAAAGAEFVAVIDDKRLAGEAGQVGACQLVQFRALV